MAADAYSRFLELHRARSPLLVANAWDAGSTVLWQRAGAPAIGTSSAAMAWACGYADGGALPVEALLHQVRSIVRVASVPVSIDLEDGYSDDPHAVAALVGQVAAAGVAGINLEDGAGRPEALVEKIQAVREALGGTPLFVNARTDIFLKAARDLHDRALHLEPRAGHGGTLRRLIEDRTRFCRLVGGPASLLVDQLGARLHVERQQARVAAMQPRQMRLMFRGQSHREFGASGRGAAGIDIDHDAADGHGGTSSV